MLTFFTIPKPFRGHIEVIQKNAIQSWRQLDPDCEILLFGEEFGIHNAALDFQAVHIPEVARNEFGTPLLHNVFSVAGSIAKHRRLCYVNTDIILMRSFIAAARLIRHKAFLMVGRRWDLEVQERIDFTVQGWEKILTQRVRKHGILGSTDGIDYFLFPKDPRLTEIPPFAVGRPGWDNWFIFRFRHLRIPVIDATGATMVVHQNHDYTHVPASRGHQWEGPEADWNRKLIGDLNRVFTLQDATHLMAGRSISRAVAFPYLKRRWQTLTVLFPRISPLVRLISKIIRCFRREVDPRTEMDTRKNENVIS